jgi:hypothetical protein
MRRRVGGEPGGRWRTLAAFLHRLVEQAALAADEPR